MNQLTVMGVIRSDLQRIWNYIDSPESTTMCILIVVALVAFSICMILNRLERR